MFISKIEYYDKDTKNISIPDMEVDITEEIRKNEKISSNENHVMNNEKVSNDIIDKLNNSNYEVNKLNNEIELLKNNYTKQN